MINMVVRMFMRQLINRGVSAGIDRAFGSRKDPRQMTAEERRQHEQAQANAKRSKRALRTLRRFGRF
ncbi:hypothetical protein [Palleronia sp.]|uniref:hypothetical protein n=1 Tax=Palleronia sp. TaxID=1940284 RepID=UPI0035C7C577